MTHNFTPGTDYKSAFEDAVTALIDEKIPDRDERMERIKALIDGYIDAVGERPDGAQLERLANEILREELTDRHPDKMSREEYPFMSVSQLDIRHEKEYLFEIAEDSIGTDLRNHAKPIRRQRTSKENYIVDQYAKIRNEERAKQYRKDTAPGKVVTYKLQDLERGIGHDNTNYDA